jgi:CPA2 family monovalent cation:H+ antiporter-2
MDIPLLQDIGLIFGLSIAVLLVGFRLRVPPIVGLFLSGLLAGPHGLALVRDLHNVDLLAEIGVILLLFTIGIEFSFKHLLEARRTMFLGGAAQIAMTVLATFGFALLAGLSPTQALFIGALIAMSSTAVTIKLLQDRAEVESPHGRAVLGISIFQDIFSVPLMMFITLLAGAAAGGDPLGAPSGLSLIAVQAAAILALSLIAARWVVPWVLFQVARTRNRELFLMSVAVICLAVAWLTSRIGLSLALGAFLAGLIVSESEYSHQALGNILPLRDVFASFFFISIGMLIDLNYLGAHLVLVAFAAVGVILFKAFLAATAAGLLGLPLRAALMTGLLLSQVGEFSFIVSTVGVQFDLIGGDLYQLFLAVSVASMGATPFLVAAAPRIVHWAGRLPLPQRVRSGLYHRSRAERPQVRDHLVIVGFGLIGRTLARAAQVGGIPFVVIEMNPETVRAERARGVPIFFGDATQEAILHHARLREARVLVVVINDAVAARKTVETARRMNPGLHIIARTRFLTEMKPLRDLGASEVIPEEFETSVEIFTRVLRKYLVPVDDIDRFVAEVRADGYEILRPAARPQVHLGDLHVPLPDHEIVACRVAPGSPAAGRALAEIELRRRHGVTVLTIRRGDQIHPNPSGHERLEAGDVAVLFGRPKSIAAALPLFADPSPPPNENSAAVKPDSPAPKSDI